MKLTFNNEYPSQIDYTELLNLLLIKKLDVLFLSKWIETEEIDNLVYEIDNGLSNLETSKMIIPDGYFYPYPYSVVQGVEEEAEIMLKKYFTSAIVVNNDFIVKGIGNVSNWYQSKLEKLLKVKLINLKTEYGLEFAKTNLRILESAKNGIDIHCENAFLHQLTPGFAEWMKLKVDLENALSVFSMIQKPDKGGELFLYDLEWKNFEYKLNESSYEERHNIDGSFFSSRGIENPKRKSIELDNGDTVIFRAAQIWHAINKIEGNKNRITLGCFIALGYDNKIYFWS
jgi:hypothetical protein